MRSSFIHGCIVAAIFVIAAAFLGYTSWNRCMALECAWEDQGHLFHIMQNLFVQGQFYSYNWGINHLGVHFTPFFFLIAPLVWMLKNVCQFVTMYAITLALGAPLVWLISSRVLKSMLAASAITVFFIFNAYLLRANEADHFEVFFVALLFAFVFFAIRKQIIPALIFLILALTVKPDVWLYAIAATLIMGSWRREPRHELIPKPQVVLYTAVSVAYFILILCLLNHLIFPAAVNRFTDSWKYGDTTWGVAWYFLRHPYQFIETTWIREGWHFQRAYLWIPVFAGINYVPAAVILALWLSSMSPYMYNLQVYYSLGPQILFLLALVRGLLNLEILDGLLRKRFSFSTFSPPKHALTILLCGLLVWTNLRSEEVQNYWARYMHWRPTNHDEQVIKILFEHPGLQDRSKSVYASYGLAGYVTARRGFFLSDRAFNDMMTDKIKPDYVVADFSVNAKDPAISQGKREILLNKLKASPEYHVAANVDLFYLFEKSN